MNDQTPNDPAVRSIDALGQCVMSELSNSEYVGVRHHVAELRKLEWENSYPTLSSLLEGMACETVQNLVLDKKEPHDHPLGRLRALWRSRGCPLIVWRECDAWIALRSIRRVLLIFRSWFCRIVLT